MKKHLKIILALLLAALVAAGGAVCVRKLYAMYANVWEKLDEMGNAIEKVQAENQALRREIDEKRALDMTYYTNAPAYDFDYAWAREGAPLIAHALGGIDGHVYTDSREAFLEGYRRGYRVFEADFTFAEDDGKLVVSHEEPKNGEKFMNALIEGAYHPMDYRDMIDLMAAYPDIYLITDTKYSDCERVSRQFELLTAYARSVDETILDRIIPQIYTGEMLPWIMELHPFRSMILTDYQIGNYNAEKMRDFCLSMGIRFVALWRQNAYDEDLVALFKDSGIMVATHTINDPEALREYQKKGVDWFYTDFIVPGEIEKSL